MQFHAVNVTLPFPTSMAMMSPSYSPAIMPPTSPIFTGRPDYSDRHLTSLQERMFKIGVEREMARDRFESLFDLVERSKDDRNEEMMKALEECNEQFNKYCEEKLFVEKEIMNAIKKMQDDRIKKAKKKYDLEDKEKKGNPKKWDEKKEQSWKEYEMMNMKDDVETVDVVKEREVIIERLCPEIEGVLKMLDCENYLKDAECLVTAMKSLKRRFEIKQTEIDEKRGATEVYEYFKGRNRKVLLMWNGCKRRDWAWSKRKAAYWILKTYGKDLQNEFSLF